MYRKGFIKLGSILLLSVLLCGCGKVQQEADTNETERRMQEAADEAVSNGSIQTTDDTQESNADKEALLKEQVFWGQNPFYSYEDPDRGVLVELYFDPEAGRGCGISYDIWYNEEQQKMVEEAGFVFEGVEIRSRQDWNTDPYSLTSVTGEKGDETDGYTETYKYREDGKIEYFLSQGKGIWKEEDADTLSDLLEISFTYREDGSLAYRQYQHNPIVWGTTNASMKSYYDEQERIIYESCYITHGAVENFYIYTDEGNIPTYSLFVDSGGSYGVQMIMYE